MPCDIEYLGHEPFAEGSSLTNDDNMAGRSTVPFYVALKTCGVGGGGGVRTVI